MVNNTKTKRLPFGVKKIPYEYVHVYWTDIQSDSSWRQIKEVEEEKLPICLSTGFLLKKDDDMVRLVSDFNFNEDGTIDECGNSTVIPTVVVKKIERFEV